MQTSMGKDWKGLGWAQKFIFLGCQNLDQPWLDLSLNHECHALTQPIFLQGLSFVAWSSFLPRHEIHHLLQIVSFHCFQVASKIKQLNLHPETVSLKHHTPLQFWPEFSCQCLKKQVFFYKSHKAHFPVVQTPSLVKHAINVMLRQSNDKMYLNSQGNMTDSCTGGLPTKVEYSFLTYRPTPTTCIIMLSIHVLYMHFFSSQDRYYQHTVFTF